MLPFQIIDGVSVYSIIWVVECGNNACGLFPHSTEGNQESQARGERGEEEETQRDIDSVIIISI